MSPRMLLRGEALHFTLERLAHHLIENHGDFSNTLLIGLQPRGADLARALVERLQRAGISEVRLGFLDSTYYRDDFRRRDEPLAPNKTEMPFLVEGARVVLVDDVLYTGRSVRSAMDALHAYGRPSEIELLVLIDRRLSRHLPIQPNYVGKTVDVVSSERIRVHWSHEDGDHTVELISGSTHG